MFDNDFETAINFYFFYKYVVFINMMIDIEIESLLVKGMV